MAEAAVRHKASPETESAQIDEFFKAILASKALKSDEKKELETIARASVEHRSYLDEMQGAAAVQARKVYMCAVCNLEFMGVLSFTEHNEATNHMRNQGSVW